MLIDGGVIHSFVTQNLVDKLQLPVTQKNFQVTLGNGQYVKGTKASCNI